MRLFKDKLRLFSRAKTPSNNEPGRKRVLFVSHEATRTGAPLIILNILKHFHETCDIQCESILHNGGQLAGEFEKHSDELICLNVPRKPGDELKKKVAKFLHREKNNLPILAICNSMESRFVAEEIASHEIPTIYLVHELPSSYGEEDYQSVYHSSQKVIFPANVVKEAADKKFPIPRDMAEVMPQGLLNPNFGKGVDPKAARKEMRNSLSLPPDAFVVLGCGTLDLRKGIDHFASTARATLELKTERPVHFVWLGDGPRWTHSPYHYVQLDLEKNNCSSRVHFIGERANVEPFFFGADAFLLSSRVDPFPCVLHEAMAAGLPIIGFDGSGGVIEALAEGSGLIVPYADYGQTARTLQLICNQPEIGKTIGERARQRVQTTFRFDTYANQIIEMAESLSRTTFRRPIRIFDARRAA